MFGSKFNDTEIIRLMREGDQRMLPLLYRRNASSIGRYIRNNGGQTADVEDMLQEGLVVLWQNVQKPDFVLTASLSTYLYSVVKNCWLKRLRKDKSMLNDPMEGDAPVVQLHTQEADEPNDQKRVVMQCMQKLDETCRKLLMRFYFDEWDMEHIASEMGFANAQTAKAKKYQCKKRLESIVKAEYTKEDLL